MKILIYSHAYPPNIGGLETITALLAERLARRGEEVTVATRVAADEAGDSASDFRVIRRPGLRELAGLVRRADVVNLVGPALMPLVLSRLMGKPAVVEHAMYQAVCPNGLLMYQRDRTICPGHFRAGRHGKCLRCNARQGRWRSLRMWLLAFPRLWLTRRAAANISVTEHVAKRLDLPASCVIDYGLPVPEERRTARAPGPVRFACVGRLVREKGVGVLIEAAGMLRAEGHDFRLLIVGDGQQRGELEAAVAAAGLGEITTFTGGLRGAELARRLEDADVVVMPSVWEEAAGLSAIEQMMRGRAVIASDIGGLGEVVDGAGLKCRPGDAGSLAAAMRQIVEDSELAGRLGRQARQRAETVFREDKMVDRHLELYRQAIG